MCPGCKDRLAGLDSQQSVRQTAALSQGFVIYSRFVYADPVRRAIHLVKYEGQRARAEWLASVILELVLPVGGPACILQAVPLTASRQANRGFNQSQEIAQYLSESTNLPLGDYLSRIRETQPQVELTGLERIENVQGAFAAHIPIPDKRIVLIDDVTTTGATMRECARVCLEGGARSVVGLSVAQGDS